MKKKLKQLQQLENLQSPAFKKNLSSLPITFSKDEKNPKRATHAVFAKTSIALFVSHFLAERWSAEPIWQSRVIFIPWQLNCVAELQ